MGRWDTAPEATAAPPTCALGVARPCARRRQCGDVSGPPRPPPHSAPLRVPGPEPLREAVPPGPRGRSRSLQPPPLCRPAERTQVRAHGPSHRAEAPAGLCGSPPARPPGPVAPSARRGRTKPARSREPAPWPTSGHFRSLPVTPRAAQTSPRPPRAPRSGPAAVLLSHARLLPHPGGFPCTKCLDLSPENVSQKHQDARPSRQPPPQPPPSAARERRATGSFSLGLQPWSSWEPQRQTSPRGTTSPRPLRSCAQLGCWGTTPVCRGGIGTTSAPGGILVTVAVPDGPLGAHTPGTGGGSGRGSEQVHSGRVDSTCIGQWRGSFRSPGSS